ncbi:Carbohydrate-responsive element-binding protein [Eumeta japonica]|uniref:Carbohydrate-responsive element-binding protein n=1 Tax=Eumeta variegata TaxID=151549 RepID=A0A4C1Z3F4_EUMVA|nr:Carbohydrate-responsive element-binding protein [Eumeta japonica]
MNHVENRQSRPGKETIHSGHFMVSHFEAEAQDDFDDLAVPVPDEEQSTPKVSVVAAGAGLKCLPSDKYDSQPQQLSIETSLTKLFKCMTLAYRYNPKRCAGRSGIRPRNAQRQVIKKQNTLICQFASPLDVDTHVKPETTILEGKYWKRRAEAVKAEYKKWRMFYITKILDKGDTSIRDTASIFSVKSISDVDMIESFSQCSDLAGSMLADEDYLNFMSDTLFSTITSHQPFQFPDPREIARGASLADFIQPSLGPLQPNLDDFMDTLEPLQELLSTASRLPPVPEESVITSEDPLYRSGMSVDNYSTQSYIAPTQNTTVVTMPTSQMTIQGTSNNNASLLQTISEPLQNIKNEQLQLYSNGQIYAQSDMQANIMTVQQVSPNYSTNYDQPTPQPEVQLQANLYAPKTSRVQYAPPQKVIPQSEMNYNKYNTVIPTPSQTAPETVSLLQQPVQNPKFNSTIIIQGRNYSRDKQSRPRIAHYNNQVQSNQYQAYPQPIQTQMTPQQLVPSPSLNYERPASTQRQTSLQIQYLQPTAHDSYKPKSVPNVINSRAFKLPSPPLASVSNTQVQVNTPRVTTVPKENYRSNSLPLGAQLNTDWSIVAPTPVAAADSGPRITARPREVSSGSLRVRSRSTSGGHIEAGAGADSSVRRPPPLNTVVSDSALPQTSIMLAQLLSTQSSQNVYKLNSGSDDGMGHNDSNKSPATRAQASPIGSDIMSPLQSASPSTSPPPSPGSPREPRRATHMHAEQKRRYNIKNGFDTLQALIPHLNNNPAAKISKAAMLQKGAEYIKQLKAERNQIKEEMESLRQQIECLNNSISNCHSLLPATGAPVSRARAGRLREMFARHVANRTMHNWNFTDHTSRSKDWINVKAPGYIISLSSIQFSVVASALVESFSACVSCSSGADLVRTTLLWAEQHCSLVEMRPAVLNSLRVLCTTTDILTNPERLPDEARAAVAASSGVKPEPS